MSNPEEITKLGKLIIRHALDNISAYNSGLEEAAKWLETADRNDTNDAEEVRKLKINVDTTLNPYMVIVNRR